MANIIQSELLRNDDKELSFFTELFKVTPAEVKEKSERLKEWYKIQPHLPNMQQDEQTIFRSLCYNKFNEEKIKIKIDAMATARSQMPEYFANRDPLTPRVSDALKSLQLIVMPSLTEKKMRISILKFNIDNHEVFDLDMFGLGFFMVSDIRCLCETSFGDILICDASNLSVGQITQLDFAATKKILNVLQNCYSTSVESIHIINAHPITELLLKVIKSILKKKISERFMVHSTVESFHKAFPVKYLPKDMGGDEPLTLKEIATKWEHILKTPAIRKVIMEIDKTKAVESKRLLINDFKIDDQLGVRGTFRKLALD